jgi:hypothetical protein
MGIKTGSINPRSLPPGLRKMAVSMSKMSEDSLHDFMHTGKTKPRTLVKG